MARPGTFRPGQSGNPGGKPKNARNRLSKRFLEDLLAHYEAGGKDAIARLCADDPARYVSIIAQLLPKEATLDVNHFSWLPDLTADQLDTLARLIEREAGASGGNAQYSGAQARGGGPAKLH